MFSEKPIDCEYSNMYEIRNKDVLLATFFYKDDNGEIAIIADYGLPQAITRSPGGWVKDRVYIDVRDGGTELMEHLHMYTVRDVLDVTYGVSMTDTYWITNNKRLRWKDVDPYSHIHAETNVSVFIDGNRELCRKDVKASPTFATDGFAPKCWITNSDGKPALVKSGAIKNNYWHEPNSEVIASQVLDRLGYSHVQYTLSETGSGKLISVCPAFTTGDIGFRPLKYYANGISDCYHLMRLLDEYNLCKEYLRILAFDYICLNDDRSPANFGLLVNNDTEKVLGMAPIFDNGMAMLTSWDGKEPLQDYVRKYGNQLVCDEKNRDDMAKYIARNLPGREDNIALLQDFKFDRNKLVGCDSARLDRIEYTIQSRAKHFVEMRA